MFVDVEGELIVSLNGCCEFDFFCSLVGLFGFNVFLCDYGVWGK